MVLGPGPQGGLRVTRCDEEEDTKAGPGPGWAALVSLLGSWPLRQVQKTDRHGQGEWAPCRSPKADLWGSVVRGCYQVALETGTGWRWGQRRPASSLYSPAGLIPTGPHGPSPTNTGFCGNTDGSSGVPKATQRAWLDQSSPAEEGEASWAP